MTAAASNVVRLPIPLCVRLYLKEGLTKFLERVSHYRDIGLTEDELQHFSEFAVRYAQHRAAIRRDPAEQRAWAASTRERLAARREQRAHASHIPDHARAL